MSSKTDAAKKKAAAAKAASAKVEKEYNASFSANFGWLDVLISQDKTDPKTGFTLKEALAEIRSKKITDPKLAANILGKTNWYQTYGVQATQNMALEKTNPGVFETNVKELKATIADEAAAKGYKLSEADLTAIARDAFIYGKAYNAATVIDSIVAKGQGYDGGEHLQTVNALKDAAFQMGVDHLTDDSFYETAAGQVANGSQTVDYYANILKENAKSQYAAIADKLDAGLTTRQIASPYIQQMASILELNPTDISMNDQYISKALTNLDDQNNPAMVPLWKFQQDLRQDPRWQQTNNAKEQYSAVAHKVLTDMGLVG